MDLMGSSLVVAVLTTNVLFLCQGSSILSIEPSNASVTEFQPLSMYCNTSNFPNSTVTWWKGSKVMSRDAKLRLSKPLRHDSGRYICNATNGSWYVTEETFVTVNYPPKLIYLTQNRTVFNVSRIALRCMATGIPTPDVSFYKDDKILTSGKRDVKLTIQPVTVNHTGWYTCVISNRLGYVTSKTYLDVLYLPTISIPGNSTLSSWLGKFFQLKCQIKSNPESNITWYKGNEILSTTADLNISITHQKQFGEYKCSAVNKVGSASRVILLKRTRFPPGAVEIINKISNLTSPNFTLRWSTAKSNGSPVIKYHIWKINDTTKQWEIMAWTNPSLKEYLFDDLVWGKTYRFKVTAINDQGEGLGHNRTFTVIKEPKVAILTPTPFPLKLVVIVSGSAVFAVLFLILCVVCCCRRKRTNQHQVANRTCSKEASFDHSMLMEELSSNLSSPGTPCDRYQGRRTFGTGHKPQHDDEAHGNQAIYDNVGFVDKSVEGWEIPRDKICIEKIIGKGAFCQVAKAFVSGLGTVAVKMIKEKGSSQTSNREDLLAEYNLLQFLGTHDNVIMVLGGVTQTDPVMVLFEYVPYGDLLGYLRRSRGLSDDYYNDPDNTPSSSLSSKQLLRFAREIADGMDFISTKKIIHRDLAARNVLVGQGETCKITDFGMARDVKDDDIYRKRKKGRLPVKWTAYEALLYGFYSTQSDVWSYAIVLYEIFTIGGTPYPDIEHRMIAENIYKGYRMPKPKHLDDEIYALMTECWKTSPDQRPSFNWISNTIKRLEKREKDYVHMIDYERDLYANLDEIWS